MHKHMTNYKGIKLCKSDMPMTAETMQTRVKQQKRREIEQRTANVQMSRTYESRGILY